MSTYDNKYRGRLLSIAFGQSYRADGSTRYDVALHYETLNPEAFSGKSFMLFGAADQQKQIYEKCKADGMLEYEWMGLRILAVPDLAPPPDWERVTETDE